MSRLRSSSSSFFLSFFLPSFRPSFLSLVFPKIQHSIHDMHIPERCVFRTLLFLQPRLSFALHHQPYSLAKTAAAHAAHGRGELVPPWGGPQRAARGGGLSQPAVTSCVARARCAARRAGRRARGARVWSVVQWKLLACLSHAELDNAWWEGSQMSTTIFSKLGRITRRR